MSLPKRMVNGIRNKARAYIRDKMRETGYLQTLQKPPNTRDLVTYAKSHPEILPDKKLLQVGRKRFLFQLGSALSGHPVAITKKSKAKRSRYTSPKKHAFYDSQEWKELRHKVLLHYGPKCMLCNATREDGVKLHVDHIKPRSKFPELALDFDNLQVLCEDCNLGKMAADTTDWRPDVDPKVLH